MSSWLRRLSRDRSSKQEQDQDDYSPDHRAATYRPATFHGPGSRKVSASKDSQFDSAPPTRAGTDDTMLRNSMPTGHSQQYGDHAAPMYAPRGNPSADNVANMHSSPRNTNRVLQDNVSPGTARPAPQSRSQSLQQDGLKMSPSFDMPEPLAIAFRESLKPYVDNINALKADLEAAHQQIASLTSETQNLHNERNNLHAWIDKRGLRPDLPPTLASSFPQSNFAASTLSTQLDRKMTMLNYSLHHLADSAPEPLPASTVTSTLSTLLPPIQHLASLPSGGPSFAFETLIKLAGNLNSHSTGEETDGDREQIAHFYDDLDRAMAGVVGRRFQARGERLEDWDVQKDVKRLDKTSAFLRKEMGVDNYFVHSLDLMRDGLQGTMFAGGNQAAGPGQGAGAHTSMYGDQGR